MPGATMTQAVDTLLARLRKQRECRVELTPAQLNTPAQPATPARVVHYLLPRPLEVAQRLLRRVPAAGAEPAHTQVVVQLADAADFVCGWSGITEADFIGAAGGSDEAPFDRRLWDELVQQRPEWGHAVCDDILERIIARLRDQEADQKNSLPG